jgi:formylglycine-generating enzyme required for sulfatase activity
MLETGSRLGSTRAVRHACRAAIHTLAACAAFAQYGVAQSSPAVIRDSLAGTLVTFELALVAGGTTTFSNSTGPRTETVRPFYIGRTEVSWEMYDVFMHRLDKPRSNAAADAIARPSMPYAVPDYEWGHDGYAAISITYTAAIAFAEWLSAKTGHRYRLPTEAEWVHAAALATGGGGLSRQRIDAIAWHSENAERKTHPIASRQPDALGLSDMFGNVAEWVLTDEPVPVTRGGSFRDDPASLGPSARAVQTPRWTERDPQLPTSRWWLTDGPFVGFRIVRDP